MKLYRYGEMSEWSNEHDWKSCIRHKRIGGSNPPLSATLKDANCGVLFAWLRSGHLPIRATVSTAQPFCRLATFPLLGESPPLSANRNLIRTQTGLGFFLYIKSLYQDKRIHSVVSNNKFIFFILS